MRIFKPPNGLYEEPDGMIQLDGATNSGRKVKEAFPPCRTGNGAEP